MTNKEFVLSRKELIEKLNIENHSIQDIQECKGDIFNTTEDLKPIKIFNNKRTIGISGANGFLSMHLIDQLLKDNSIQKIKCFVRNKEKFYQAKDHYQLNFSLDKVVLIEEYSKENFIDIDDFIHSAASIHSLKTYNQLKADNVELTKKLLYLCPEKTYFHYISTLSVYASSNHKGVAPRKSIQNNEHLFYGGYAQTKWAGEFLVDKKINSKIYRLGLLTPSLHNPVFKKD